MVLNAILLYLTILRGYGPVALPRMLMFNPIFEFCFSILICVIYFLISLIPHWRWHPIQRWGTFPSRCSGKVPHLWIGLPPWIPLSFYFLFFISCYNFFVQVKYSMDLPLAILQLFWYTVMWLSSGVNFSLIFILPWHYFSYMCFLLCHEFISASE